MLKTFNITLKKKLNNYKKYIFYLLHGTFLWDNPVGQSCGTILWDNPVGQSCGTILWDNPVGQSCGTFLNSWKDETAKSMMRYFFHRIMLSCKTVLRSILQQEVVCRNRFHQQNLNHHTDSHLFCITISVKVWNTKVVGKDQTAKE